MNLSEIIAAHPQGHLWNPELSWTLNNGWYSVRYDPFPGDWRLSDNVELFRVNPVTGEIR